MNFQAVKLLFYLAYSKFNILYRKLFFKGRRYRPNYLCGHRVLTPEQGNNKLAKMIESGIPFAAIRYGGVETNTYIEGKSYLVGIRKKMRQEIVDTAQRQAGFFPNNTDILPRYVSLIEETSKEIDFLATYATRMENYMINNFMSPSVIVSDNRALEPYYFQHNEPWTKALKGKRVLVIHPFVDSIKNQYNNREKLFDDPDILPEFELKTLKAVQTIVGTKDERFSNWFDALNYMYDEALKINFDVALIGCGAYGQPLACMLKKAGKQAIHIGGATQIMFGIIGRRWELNSKEVSSLFNEHWIRPSAEETPLNKEKNEFGGAYW